MKTVKMILAAAVVMIGMASCSEDEMPVPGNGVGYYNMHIDGNAVAEGAMLEYEADWDEVSY